MYISYREIEHFKCWIGCAKCKETKALVTERIDSTILHFSIELTKYSYNVSNENKTIHFFVPFVVACQV